MKFKKVSTVFLPKTDFPALPAPAERSGLDTRLAALGNFAGFYQWQRTRKQQPKATNAVVQSDDFVILDGPPYANGDAHVGHAINRLMKDFLLKSRVQIGQRVDFRPGWDCHGMPIEHKIKREQQRQQQSTTADKPFFPKLRHPINEDDPVWVRRECRQLAHHSIRSQMDSFLRWGCTADFADPYVTMSADYVAGQLERFAQLYERGLIRRALRPVYWSPSSRTALAESELEYNKEHRSVAVFFRFLLINFDLQQLQSHSPVPSAKKPTHIYLLTWTTTPWTLPLNNAIAVHPRLEYAAIEFPTETRTTATRNIYIVAKKLVPEIGQQLGLVPHILGTISGEQLAQEGRFYYKNAMYNDLAQPILAANFVKDDVGTGLVHLSYAHGHEDYQIGSQRGDLVECFVDEQGRYTRHMGHQLEGKEVLGEGTQAALALNHLRKDVLRQSEHIHAYPYDWRTQQPVIIRACAQWFFDVSSLNAQCLEALEGDSPKIRVSSGANDLRSSFTPFFSGARALWCISRQRCWGVPIPAVGHLQADGEPKTNGTFVRAYAELVRSKQDTDLWWNLTLKDLSKLEGFPFPGHQLGELQKETEVMDVWLDSGLAWSTLPMSMQQKTADVVAEGHDQFRGWFQSLMITSLALQETIPFKRILVHGKAVDEEGKKMSKSRGNVVQPEAITDGKLYGAPIGADGLRYWAAWRGSESGEVQLGPSMIEEVRKRLKRIRVILRFVLGALQSAKERKRAIGQQLRLWPTHIENGEGLKLRTLDRCMLASLDGLTERIRSLFLDHQFSALMEQYFQFTQKEVSAYITCLRDRLYCEPPNSAAHDAALWTLDVVGRTLIQTIAPIMPHLAVEFFTHHPTLSADPELAFRQCFDADGQPLKDTQVQRMIGNREQLQELMELLRLGKSQVADQLQHRSGKEMEDAGLCLQISGTAQQMSLLGAIHPPGNLPYSELVELFSCAFVRLNWEEPTSEFRVQLLDPLSEGLDWCSRCRKRNNQRARKKTAEEESELCERCEHAVEELVAMEVGRMDVKKDINSSGSAASTPIVPSSSAGA